MTRHSTVLLTLLLMWGPACGPLVLTETNTKVVNKTDQQVEIRVTDGSTTVLGAQTLDSKSAVTFEVSAGTSTIELEYDSENFEYLLSSNSYTNFFYLGPGSSATSLSQSMFICDSGDGLTTALVSTDCVDDNNTLERQPSFSCASTGAQLADVSAEDSIITTGDAVVLPDVGLAWQSGSFDTDWLVVDDSILEVNIQSNDEGQQFFVAPAVESETQIRFAADGCLPADSFYALYTVQPVTAKIVNTKSLCTLAVGDTVELSAEAGDGDISNFDIEWQVFPRNSATIVQTDPLKPLLTIKDVGELVVTLHVTDISGELTGKDSIELEAGWSGEGMVVDAGVGDIDTFGSYSGAATFYSAEGKRGPCSAGSYRYVWTTPSAVDDEQLAFVSIDHPCGFSSLNPDDSGFGADITARINRTHSNESYEFGLEVQDADGSVLYEDTMVIEVLTPQTYNGNNQPSTSGRTVCEQSVPYLSF